MIRNNYQAAMDSAASQLPIVFKSLAVGLVSAAVSILYRLALSSADSLRSQVLAAVHGQWSLVLAYFAALAVLALATGWLVRRYPMIGGSGIPQVKGQIKGLVRCPWQSTLLAKFIGGLVTGLAGLSVGREGPSIQLGSSAAHGLADRLAATRVERKILIASGASAGLAAAFNAPLAGVVFAFEEIFKYISPIILLSTISAAVMADYLSKLVFGFEPAFDFHLVADLPLSAYWLLILLGALTGLGGAIYNRFMLTTIKAYQKLGSLRPWLKELLPFTLAGVLGLTFPIVLGGGHPIIEAITPQVTLGWLVLVLVVKFLFSALSFGSGVPGGIFFPLLILGALIGATYAEIATLATGLSPDLLPNLMILAMAGFFTAIVRAPITGILLLTEMTGSFAYILPLTLVSITSYVVAELLKSQPIYDSLLDNLVARQGVERPERDQFRKIVVSTIVHHGAPVENKAIRDVKWPEGALVVAIRRHGLDITPHGDTVMEAEDELVVLTNIRQEGQVRYRLEQLAEYVPDGHG